MRWLSTLDRGITATRPGWAWAGQLALVVLGTHRGADHLDDLLAGWLTPLALPWPSPESPLVVAAGGALVFEVLAIALATGWLLVSAGQPPADGATLRRTASVRAVTAPLFWLATTLAGTWSVALAAEDLLGVAAPWLPWVVAALVFWRVGAPGCARIARQLPPARRFAGLSTAPVLLSIGALAIRHGLPVWGWL
ncbi:MAG: hypothetical protein ACI8PZ_003734 [Myxococcota bacterium]|jgi:hypothetical protein